MNLRNGEVPGNLPSEMNIFPSWFSFSMDRDRFFEFLVDISTMVVRVKMEQRKKRGLVR
jgi:hypothetical protein